DPALGRLRRCPWPATGPATAPCAHQRPRPRHGVAPAGAKHGPRPARTGTEGLESVPDTRRAVPLTLGRAGRCAARRAIGGASPAHAALPQPTHGFGPRGWG